MNEELSTEKSDGDFRRESLQINQELERLTEMLEDISVKLTCMAYDMVEMRTRPGPAESLRSLREELLKCEAVTAASTTAREDAEEPRVPPE